ncbi:MAG: histidinol-phosphate transaminase [Chitinivibrionales bacterium]|nr:histidinol-phosphate transaminase [Chitinivibrionales bacterium]
MELKKVLPLIRPQVRNLTAYHLDRVECDIKLNQNENPFDWPGNVKNEVAEFVKERFWNRYPSFIPVDLKKSIADYCDVCSENIIVGNGSNEMLLVLLLALMEKETPVIACQPTFTVYNLLVNGLGGTPRTVMLDENLRYDCDAICSACEESPEAVLIIASPNNPTGTSLKKEQLEKILSVHKGFFILDQAYVEFGGFNAVPLIDKYPNCIITRTFSKALGAAGLRLGYMIGNKEVIAEINKIKLPYNINFFSEKTAQVLLENRSYVTEKVTGLIAERNDLYGFFSKLPFDNCYSSDTNFILVRTAGKNELFKYLKSKGILVRDVSSYPMLENCLRINIGTARENQALKHACEEFFAKSKTPVSGS